MPTIVEQLSAYASALRYEDLGYAMQPDELDAIYQRFTTLADRKKRMGKEADQPHRIRYRKLTR